MQIESSLEKWQAARTKEGERQGQEPGPLTNQRHSMLGLRMALGTLCPKLPASPLKSSPFPDSSHQGHAAYDQDVGSRR